VWLGETFLGSIASLGSDFDSLKKEFEVSGLCEGEKEMVLTVLQGELNLNEGERATHLTI